MKQFLQLRRLSSLVRQRNLLISLTAGMLASNIILSVCLLTKSEHVILMPPELKQQVWVERNQVSAAYLEEMAVFMTGLMLSISPTSAAYQHEIVLRYAGPESYGSLKAQLLADQQRLVKDNLSTVFRPHHVSADTSRHRVILSGDLMNYVGDKRVSQVRESYELVFTLQRGQLQLKSFKFVEANHAES